MYVFNSFGHLSFLFPLVCSERDQCEGLRGLLSAPRRPCAGAAGRRRAAVVVKPLPVRGEGGARRGAGVAAPGPCAGPLGASAAPDVEGPTARVRADASRQPPPPDKRRLLLAPSPPSVAHSQVSSRRRRARVLRVYGTSKKVDTTQITPGAPETGRGRDRGPSPLGAPNPVRGPSSAAGGGPARSLTPSRSALPLRRAGAGPGAVPTRVPRREKERDGREPQSRGDTENRAVPWAEKHGRRHGSADPLLRFYRWPLMKPKWVSPRRRRRRRRVISIAVGRKRDKRGTRGEPGLGQLRCGGAGRGR